MTTEDPKNPSDVDRVAAAVAVAAATRHLLLLTDFDGTLCEFKSDPEAVRLSDSRRALLSTLASRPRVTVGVVSGRRLEDVRHRTALSEGVFFAGLHGLEIEGGGVRFVHPEVQETRVLLQETARTLAAEIRSLPGALVENKDLSVALHVRAAGAEDRPKAEHALARIAGPYLSSGALRLQRGDAVLELLPDIQWNKGSAVMWIREAVERATGQSVATFYCGDDLTDEDAFRALAPAGITVLVGNRPSAAMMRIADPSAVEALLARLVRDGVGT